MSDNTTPTGQLDTALRGSTLAPLRKLAGYRIAAGDPDVQGWEVLGSDGRKIGEVDDLLVDTRQLRARYLDVILDPGLCEESAAAGEAVNAGPQTETAASPKLLGLTSMMEETMVRATLTNDENRLTRKPFLGFNARHVLIPVGRARLDTEHDRILVKGLRSLGAPSLPDYTGQILDRDYETNLRQRFDETYVPSQEQDFYAHPLYDEDLFYGPRRIQRDPSWAERLQ